MPQVSVDQIPSLHGGPRSAAGGLAAANRQVRALAVQAIMLGDSLPSDYPFVGGRPCGAACCLLPLPARDEIAASSLAAERQAMRWVNLD